MTKVRHKVSVMTAQGGTTVWGEVESFNFADGNLTLKRSDPEHPEDRGEVVYLAGAWLAYSTEVDNEERPTRPALEKALKKAEEALERSEVRLKRAVQALDAERLRRALPSDE